MEEDWDEPLAFATLAKARAGGRAPPIDEEALSVRGRRVRSTVAVGIAATGLVGVGGALAAHPQRGVRYSGKGKLCENDSANYSACMGQRDAFSFRTAANGSRITGFSGAIGPLYCGGNTPYVGAKFLHVTNNGSFDYRFNSLDRYLGKVQGTTHVEIRGRFTGNGSMAHIFYSILTDFTGKGQYPCGARVTGIARAG